MLSVETSLDQVDLADLSLSLITYTYTHTHTCTLTRSHTHTLTYTQCQTVYRFGWIECSALVQSSTLATATLGALGAPTTKTVATTPEMQE